MTEHYNKSIMKQRRKMLRNNLSEAEMIMWSHLSRRRMHGFKFRRQYSIDEYVIDFYCPEIKLAVEIDGDSHLKTEAKEYDTERRIYIEAFGIRFLRFTNEEVYRNIESVCQIIYNKIDELLQNDKIKEKNNNP